MFGVLGVISGLAGIAIGAAGWAAPGKVFKGWKEKPARRAAVGIAVFGLLVVANGVRLILRGE